MHDSRGLFDRFIGTVAPDEIFVSRKNIPRTSAELSADERMRLRDRLTRLMMAGANGQHFSTRFISKTESLGFYLKKVENTMEVMQPLNQYVVPDSVRI